MDCASYIPEHALDAAIAQQLNVNTGCASLYMRRICHDQQGEFLELDEEFWLHNALKVVVSVKPPKP